MLMSSISNAKLHCYLLILIVALIIFLYLPLLLIKTANEHLRVAVEFEDPKNDGFERGQSVVPVNCHEFAKEANLSILPDGGSFACRNCPEICVLQALQCNKVPDCPDSSDEALCMDYTGHLENFYSNILPKTYNKLNDESANLELDYDIPDSCTGVEVWNQTCKCNQSETEVVLCEWSGLVMVPVLLDSVWKLHLNNNMISEIDLVRWPSALGSLNLEYNQLTRLSEISFANARNLSNLYLNRNQISEIEPNTFVSLERLERLYIEYNRLTSFHTKLIDQNHQLRRLHLKGNQIELDDGCSFGGGKFPQLKDLDLDDNLISVVRSHFFSNVSSLEYLSLQNNRIALIEPNAFDLDGKLIELNLMANNIKQLARATFARNLPIRNLKLGSNPLELVPADAFKEVLLLESLDLQGVELENCTISRATFSYLTRLKWIVFNQFWYCHYAPHARVCKPGTDGLSSSYQLLAFPILKSAVWYVALVCMVGNSLVFIWRSVSSHEDQSLSLFIRNLSIADLLMGVYLASIGLADQHYGNNFILYAIDWMSSWSCAGIGFLAILSSELSVCIVTIITLERYRSIVVSGSRCEPGEQRRRARLFVCLAWALSLLIAAYPLLEWSLRESDYFATNALCLPLHIDQPYTRGWHYSAFIYLGVNLAAVFVIMLLYALMYKFIVSWRQTSRPAFLNAEHLEKREDTILAIRFFFIVITDCVCWIPIVVIKLLALNQIKISSSIYGWLVVFIIPVNSALNPIVYTLAAPSSLRAAACRLVKRLYHSLRRAMGCAGGPTSRSPAPAAGPSEVFAASSSGSSSASSTASSLSAGSGSGPLELPVAGRRTLAERRRLTRGSNSTSTCETLDSSLASHSKAAELEPEPLLEESATLAAAADSGPAAKLDLWARAHKRASYQHYFRPLHAQQADSAGRQRRPADGLLRRNRRILLKMLNNGRFWIEPAPAKPPPGFRSTEEQPASGEQESGGAKEQRMAAARRRARIWRRP